jgi:hypothetical protein
MHIRRESGGRRLGAKTLLLGSVAGAVIAATAFVPALASPVVNPATGATTVTLGGKAYNTLLTGGCGALTVLTANGVTATTTAKGAKLIFPVSGYETQPSNDDALRIDHTGSVTLQNACYTISLASLRITNFGLPNQGSSFDLSAVTKSADDSGRQVIGTLDLGSSVVTFSGTKIEIAKMNLLTADEGAQELNELAVGAETGPFVTGQQIGSAKTRVVFQ